MVVIQYQIASLKQLEDYLQNHAPGMRSITTEKFGDQIAITRRILAELHD